MVDLPPFLPLLSVLQELSPAELHSLYRWIDSLPLTKAKKNIARDFSDGGHCPSFRLLSYSLTLRSGPPFAFPSHSPSPPSLCCSVLMSQVLHHYHPRLVDLHNYTSTLSPPQKQSNWQTLNAKVLRKLRCPVPAEEVDRLVKGERGAIERLLWGIFRRTPEWEEGRTGRRGGGDGRDEAEDELVMTADGSIYPWPVGAVGDGRGKAEAREGSGRDAASKDRIIADQRDAIEVSSASTCSTVDERAHGSAAPALDLLILNLSTAVQLCRSLGAA